MLEYTTSLEELSKRIYFLRRKTYLDKLNNVPILCIDENNNCFVKYLHDIQLPSFEEYQLYGNTLMYIYRTKYLGNVVKLIRSNKFML